MGKEEITTGKGGKRAIKGALWEGAWLEAANIMYAGKQILMHNFGGK